MGYFKVSLIHKGKRQAQIIEAENKNSAKDKIKHKYSSAIITKIEPTSAPLDVIAKDFFADLQKQFKKTININDKIATIRQIAVMTDAGLPIHDTLADVAVNTQNKQLSDIYYNISGDIDAGKSLSDSMERYRDEFGHITLAMAK